MYKRDGWRNRLLTIGSPAALLLLPVGLALVALLDLQPPALWSTLSVAAALLVGFWLFERRGASPRELLPIVVLAAIAAAGRILFSAIPGVQPATAIVMVAGAYFGKQSGFLTGSLAALASNMLLGQGAWTVWQMYAWGLIGYLAGVLEEHGAFSRPPAVYVYGALAGLLYGLVVDGWHVLGYVSPLSWTAVLTAYAMGLPHNVWHAASTVLFLIPVWRPWGRKLARIRRKFGWADAERL